MTAVLGISSFYHDSAATLIVDGKIVAAASEELFSRKKHDASFPSQAIQFCLDRASLTADQIDFIGFHEKPLLKFDRLLETHLAFAPAGYGAFRAAIPSWLTTKLRLPRIIRRELNGAYRRRIVYGSHHQSHAASAFFPSPFEEAAIVTTDGVGEWSTTTWGVGRGNRIETNHDLRFPHSLGLLYSAITAYCGFSANGDEYKLMGLASYGEPTYRDLIRHQVMDLKSDGSFRLEMKYFNYCQGLTMTSSRLTELLGFPPRVSEQSEITQQYMDLAASVQSIAEEVMLRIARNVHAKTGMTNLVMAGGVALNCVANGRIRQESPFENVWVQPAAGDSGGTLGIALLIWHQLLGNERSKVDANNDAQHGSLLGPVYDDAKILAMLRAQRAEFQEMDGDRELCETTANLLAKQKIVAWFQGPAEFGPRALGSRSILADPRDHQMQQRLNVMVKNRESFRPFAPATLIEEADQHFEIQAGEDLPYMLFTVPCRSASSLPAVAHVDHSSRLQTVDQQRNPLFHQLLRRFDQITDCPTLVNTSFNVRDEPIVCTPLDAYRCYENTDIDALVIGRYVLQKGINRAAESHASRSSPNRFAPQTKPRWLNLEVPWDPSIRILQRFAFSFLYSLPLMAFVFGQSWAHVAAVFLLAIPTSLGGYLFPRITRVFYRALLVGILPLVLLLSELMLTLIFYVLMTPIGMTLRRLGYHGLELHVDRNSNTYWNDLNDSHDVKRYYRQS